MKLFIFILFFFIFFTFFILLAHSKNPSSDGRLQLAYMKLESLVITGQPYGGEFVLGPYTHSLSVLKFYIFLDKI